MNKITKHFLGFAIPLLVLAIALAIIYVGTNGKAFQ